MSRYTGPRLRVMRALGVVLPGLSRKSPDRRPYPPGQHGDKRRSRPSDYGIQLKEKQKLRYNYGLNERQMRRLVKEARSAKLATGDKLLELLERRLDNVVFRAGFAPTIPAARQLVTHRHFSVNGRTVNIPSYRVRPGDKIQVRERSRKVEVITTTMAAPPLLIPDWIAATPDDFSASVESLPTGDHVPFEIDVQSVVEYYAKRM